MFCPSCGKTIEAGQRYCRACGLGLSKVAGIVSERQPPAGVPERASPEEVARLLRRKRDVECWLNGIGAGVAAGFLLAVVAVLFFRQAVEQAGAVEDAVLLAFTVAGLAALALAFYRESLKKSLAVRGVAGETDERLHEGPATSKFLPESRFEPVLSVTDRTTELLAAEPKSRRQ